jgi:hypothetical protein
VRRRVQDKFALVLSLLTLHLWYTLDHDEWLRLYHYHHHRFIDSLHSIYVKGIGLPPIAFDGVKPLVMAYAKKSD